MTASIEGPYDHVQSSIMTALQSASVVPPTTRLSLLLPACSLLATTMKAMIAATTPRELLVLPRRLGWGWRLNLRHRFALPFLGAQIAFFAGPLLGLRYAGVEANEAYGGRALAVSAVSAAIWFVLARKPI